MISVRGLYYPDPVSTTVTNITQNTTTNIFGNVFSIPKTGNITHVGYRHGGNVAANRELKIETLNSDGQPSGTLYHADSFTSAGSATANSWNEVALNDTVPVTAGDPVALTIQNTTAGNMNYSRVVTVVNTSNPYTIIWDGATWTKNVGAPMVGLKYDDGNYAFIPGVHPYSSLVNQTFNSGSVLTERGIKFNFPFDCEIEGLWVGYGNATGDFETRLYKGSSLEQSRSWVANHSVLTNNNVNLIPFTGNVVIEKNTDYYASVLATSGTNTQIRHLTYASTAQLAGISGGDRFTSVRRADPSASWIEYSDERILLGLIISAVEEGGGGIDSYGYSA